MTDYIVEMMRTARVDTVIMKRYCRGGEYREYCLNICGSCKNNKHFFVYPDFTPEKQLEIIKLIFKNCFVDIENNKINFSYNDAPITYNMNLNNFAQNLAALVNNLWKYLADKDKEKVKEILEG